MTPKTQATKDKRITFDYIKVKRQPTEWEKIFMHYIPHRSLVPEYIKYSFNSTIRQVINFKNWANDWIDISPKR